jgi:hypothetical protein
MDEPKNPIEEWGMVLDPPIELSAEEIPLFLQGIADLKAGRVRPLEDIERDLEGGK